MLAEYTIQHIIMIVPIIFIAFRYLYFDIFCNSTVNAYLTSPWYHSIHIIYTGTCCAKHYILTIVRTQFQLKHWGRWNPHFVQLFIWSRITQWTISLPLVINSIIVNNNLIMALYRTLVLSRYYIIIMYLHGIKTIN